MGYKPFGIYNKQYIISHALSNSEDPDGQSHTCCFNMYGKIRQNTKELSTM